MIESIILFIKLSGTVSPTTPFQREDTTLLETVFLVLPPRISLAVGITKIRVSATTAAHDPSLLGSTATTDHLFGWVAESWMIHVSLLLHVFMLAFCGTIETLATLANQQLVFGRSPIADAAAFHMITRHLLQLVVWNSLVVPIVDGWFHPMKSPKLVLAFSVPHERSSDPV